MSTYSVHATGKSGEAHVTREANLADIRDDFHLTKIAFSGGVTVNLTDKEGRRLWEELGEIYAGKEPGVVESPQEIATRIATQKSIGGFSGIEANTRRIIEGAAYQAALAARGMPEKRTLPIQDRFTSAEERGDA